MQLSRYLEKLSADPHVLLASLVINVLSLAVPVLMLQIYDRVIPRQGVETLTVLAIGTTIAILAEMIIRGARTRLMALAGDAFERRVQIGMFRHLLKADISAIEADPPGTHIERLASIDRVKEFRHGESAMVLFDIPFIGLFLLASFAISIPLTLVIVAILAISIMANSMTRAGLAELSEEKRKLDARRFSFLLETLNGIEAIKSLNMESFMERRYERLMASSAEIGSAATLRRDFAQSIVGVLGQLTPFLIAAAGSILVISHSITVGALAAAILLGTRIVQPILRFEALRSADYDAMRAEADLNRVLMAPLRKEGEKTCKSIEHLELRGVHFHPAEREKPLFRDLSFSLRRGEFVAVHGNVASGRSTLLWMMMRLINPGSGEVLINGEPAADFNAASLRRRIAYLSPTPKLLEGTVLDNMTRFQPNLHFEDAIEISAALGLSAYFAQHQEGLKAKVGGGVDAGLPTSVTERIPLVGALVGKPDIILFDEANANLDMAGDKRLRDYLASLKGKAAVVLVTQRPSYLALADRSVEIHDGAIRAFRPVDRLSSEEKERTEAMS